MTWDPPPPQPGSTGTPGVPRGTSESVATDRSDGAPSRAARDDIEEIADAVAAVALSVPGVTRLHSGVFGEVGTYLPGRRVAGVKTGESLTEVHVVVSRNARVLETAEAVRRAVRPLVATPVDVFVEDLDSPATP